MNDLFLSLYVSTKPELNGVPRRGLMHDVLPAFCSQAWGPRRQKRCCACIRRRARCTRRGCAPGGPPSRPAASSAGKPEGRPPRPCACWKASRHVIAVAQLPKPTSNAPCQAEQLNVQLMIHVMKQIGPGGNSSPCLACSRAVIPAALLLMLLLMPHQYGSADAVAPYPASRCFFAGVCGWHEGLPGAQPEGHRGAVWCMSGIYSARHVP